MLCKPGLDLPFSNLGRPFWKEEAELAFSGLQSERLEGGHQQALPSLFQVRGKPWVYSERWTTHKVPMENRRWLCSLSRFVPPIVV